MGTWPVSTDNAGYYGATYQVQEANGVPPSAVVVDNAQDMAEGTWPNSTSWGGYYGADYDYHVPGTGANTFSWTLNEASVGTYQMYARWTASTTRTTSAAYTIVHAGGSDTVSVNQ